MTLVTHLQTIRSMAQWLKIAAICAYLAVGPIELSGTSEYMCIGLCCSFYIPNHSSIQKTFTWYLSDLLDIGSASNSNFLQRKGVQYLMYVFCPLLVMCGN